MRAMQQLHRAWVDAEEEVQWVQDAELELRRVSGSF
jgi:hypothetical protein